MTTRCLEKPMILSRPRSLLAGAVLSALCGLAGAQETAPAPVEQRLHEEVQSLLVRLVESGALPDEAGGIALAAPASRQPDRGAFLDVRWRAGADTGLPVLGVTPGSSAARLGVQPGDRLLAVNGTTLTGLGADGEGRSVAAQALREALLANSEALELSVARGDAVQVLRGTVNVVQVPAYRLELGAAIAGASIAGTGGGDGVSSCGRISVFDVAPRSQHLYKAVLIAVDGKLPGPTSSDVFRLEPGRHVLRVAEAIDPKQFDSLQRLTRDRRRGDDHYKDLEVDVQPGTTYRLASRFNYDQRNSIRDNAYWDPVIWTEIPETCR
jgi:hypothetical protein